MVHPSAKTPDSNIDDKGFLNRPYPTKTVLEQGNEVFVRLIDQYYRHPEPSVDDLPRWIEPWAIPMEKPGHVPEQTPFAAVVACSDARVPVRALFSCKANELFEIRVAGNVLADECLGSIDYAIEHLRPRLDTLVVLGHTGCGAVTAAVDVYLQPASLTSRKFSIGLRSIFQRLLGPVRQAAAALERRLDHLDQTHWQGDQDKLIDAAVCINAASAAQELQETLSSKHADVQVYYGIYDLASCRVCSFAEDATHEGYCVSLAKPPQDTEGLDALANRIATRVTSASLFG